MLLEGVFNVFFILIDFIINLLPFSVESSYFNFSALFDVLGYGIYVIGPTCFIAIVGTWLTWTTINLGWAVIEWLYKKIPGVN